MSKRRELSEEQQKIAKFEKVLRGYQTWQAAVEDHNIDTIRVGDEEYCFYDILDGIKTLPPRQRQAFDLIVIEGKKEVQAAREMGFQRWSTPVQQYKNIAVKKLWNFQQQQARLRRVTDEAS
ncbi:hypothetical protein [Streptomyces sp. CoH17]|uniref:hypothetical protein n=1 Tax=Streptomyces sp. CoH17 TaxID=2992806 RepID=UPI00226ECB12|nr:hypothetical protein [Streptomyces sp. CoH17]